MATPFTRLASRISAPHVAVRLRLLLALGLLALPLGGAVLVVGHSAASTERAKADARLGSALQSALRQYAAMLTVAELRALKLATSERVQSALRDSNRVELRRLSRLYPDVTFQPGERSSGGDNVFAAGRRAVSVVVGGRRLGSVVVMVPLDAAHLVTLKREAGLRPEEQLSVEHGGDGRHPQPARTVRVNGGRYRSLAAPLLAGSKETMLLVLTPSERIDTAANAAERRIFSAGFGTLIFVALLGYALAPAIARARVGRQQREQAARILSHVGDGVFLVDGDGVIRSWNAAAEMITGLTARAVEGRPADEAIPGWSTASAVVCSGGLVRSGERVRAVTIPLHLESGELWLSVSAVESAEGTVYAFRDLTEEGRLEAMRRDVVATVSHELRTPLTSVHGAALTLREQQSLSEEQRHRLLGMLVDESDRLAQLIEQILLASQVDAGTLQTAHERFDLGAVARDVVETSRSHAPAEVALELSVAPALPSAIGDPQQARQVLNNLIDNAIKYSPDGGKVELDLHSDGSTMRVAVRDHGLGIPAAERDRVFEKFYRLDPLLRRGIGGTGLGLYICRELVRRMQGNIWVESQEGSGSTFYVELPAAR